MVDLEFITRANTLIDILDYRAKHQPERVAYNFLVDGETETVSLTYQQLATQAKAIAYQLQTHCHQGDQAVSHEAVRCLLLYPSGLDYITAFFGCLWAGVIAIPAYPPRPNRSLSRLESIIKNAKPRIVLSVSSILTNLTTKLQQNPEIEHLIWIATDKLQEYSQSHSNQELPTLKSNHIAFLQYTSGSTATPKGVMISHGNLLHNLNAIDRYFEHTPASHGVIWLPMYHDMGLIGGVLEPIYGGFPVTLMSPLMFLQRPLRWLEAISRYRATTSGAPNFAYDFCVRKIKPSDIAHLDLSCWKVAFNGAEPIKFQTLEDFSHLFKPCGFRHQSFYPCYGMAEATLIVSGGGKNDPIKTKKLCSTSLEQNKAVSVPQEAQHTQNTKTIVGCGQSIPGQTIKIVNPDTLIQCQVGEIGEIWVSGGSIAQGYWSQPELTQGCFNAYLKDIGEHEQDNISTDQQAKKWLRTGDLGFIDEGELYITGRLKDLIIINGSNYYPQDIEWTVEQSDPHIQPNCTAAFSLMVEDTEKLVVITEVERGFWRRYTQAHSTGNNGKEDFADALELIRKIKRNVRQNHDLEIYAVELLKPGTVPKTSSGKIKRQACQKMFRSGTLESLTFSL